MVLRNTAAGSVFSLFMYFLFVVGCQPKTIPSPPAVTPTAAAPPLRIGVSEGASSLAELVNRLYRAEQGQPKVHLFEGNDETLLAGLDEKLFDAVLVFSVPEKKDYWFNPVALDGLVFFVHPDNPLSDLTLSDIQAIYSGEIDNWAAVSGPDTDIVLLSREDGSGARTALEDRVLIGQPIDGEALIIVQDEALYTKIISDTGAIGYGMMGDRADPLMLAIDGIEAIPANVSEQIYPLTVPLYFVSAEEPTNDLRAFLAWLQSPETQVILGEKYGRVR